MVPSDTTSIVCGYQTTQEGWRLQSVPSGAVPGRQVVERTIKSLSGNGDTEHGETAISLRGGISEAVAVRREAVARCQWLVHRHLATASRRKHGSPLNLLPPTLTDYLNFLCSSSTYNKHGHEQYNL